MSSLGRLISIWFQFDFNLIWKFADYDLDFILNVCHSSSPLQIDEVFNGFSLFLSCSPLSLVLIANMIIWLCEPAWSMSCKSLNEIVSVLCKLWDRFYFYNKLISKISLNSLSDSICLFSSLAVPAVPAVQLACVAFKSKSHFRSRLNSKLCLAELSAWSNRKASLTKPAMKPANCFFV